MLFTIVLFYEVVYIRRRIKEGDSWRQSRSELVAFCTPFLIIGLSYFAWRLAYYGFLFPNTYYAKHSGNRLNNLPLGLLYIGQAFSSYLVVPFALLAGLLVRSSIAGRWRRVILPLATIPAVYAAYIMWMGGDDTAAFPSARLLAPVIPIIYLVLVVALEESLKSATHGKQIMVSSIAVVLCVLSWTSDGLTLLKRSNPELTSSVRPSAFISFVASKIDRLNQDKADELSVWIRQNTRSDDLIAVPWAGRVPYYTDRPVLDMLGLNDLHIAHVEPQQRGIDVKMDPAYILARKPKLIFVNVDSTYWRGEASFEGAGGWKLGDKLLLDMLRKSSEYVFVEGAPTTISVFQRVTSEN